MLASVTMLLDSTARQLAPGVRTVEDEAAPGRGRKLVCRRCHATITDEGQRVSVEGQHVHTRLNPAGINFCFGCFAAAPGCALQGAASSEFSWFEGCRWRIALCAECGAHLGWVFDGARHFYALILSRLAGVGDS